MFEVILRSFGFLLIIILGYLLKQYGFFKAEDSKTLSKVVFKITFPCAILMNVPKITISNLTFIIIGIGFACNLIMFFVGKIAFRKQNRLEQSVAMINCSSYNLGNLTMPFALTTFTGVGLEYLCMLDIGNAILAFGGSYALAFNYLSGKKGIDFRFLFKSLVNSFPFVVYMFILISSILSFTLPSEIISIVAIAGNANSFVVMLMIGTMLSLSIEKEVKNTVFKILTIRIIAAFILASIVYFILPLPLIARQIISLGLVSAPTVLVPVFARELGDNSSTSAIVNSLNIIIAIILKTGMLMFFNA